MKILTINVRGIPSGSSSDLINANVFQDYDAVVVDPYLGRLYGLIANDLYDGKQLDYQVYLILLRANINRRKQINGLLQRGGAVVCFMEPVEKCRWRDKTRDRLYSISNYDWLIELDNLEAETGSINVGRGQTIDYIDSGHPFSEYLNTKPTWSAYVDIDVCKGWKIIASAYGTHAVALTKRVGLGHIVLLPSYYDHQNGELLERCIIKLLGDKEIIPQPDWAKAISVPGQEERITRITQVNEQIDTLDEERKKLITESDNLERWKWLLYEKGKHRLEPVVRDSLALLGCHVEPQPDKASDGIVTFEHGAALLEVVGSKATIKIEKLGELIKNMGNFIAEKGGRVKGVLVGNPFCEEPLDNRPPINTQKKLFAKELIESAEQQSITVLLSTDLYEVVSRVLMSKLCDAEKQSLRERIFNGKGLVKLVW